MRGIYLLPESSFTRIYGEKEKIEIAGLVQIEDKCYHPDDIKENPSLLKDVELIFSGWGAPLLNKEFLDMVPKLKAVFYGAGSIKGMVTDEFWEKNIPITSAYAANAIPVAEFTYANIILCLKKAWHYAGLFSSERKRARRITCPGCFGTTVGIVSLGMIGLKVVEMLKNLDVNVIAYDPYAGLETAKKAGVVLHSLEDVFRLSDVVTLHTPWLPETEGMIKGSHIRLMKTDASLINTSRGAVINEPEMTEALAERPDIQAVLDVTYPEPPLPGNPILELPNVVIFPHIAGSMDKECERMGSYMVDELRKFLNGEDMKWRITKEKNATMA